MTPRIPRCQSCRWWSDMQLRDDGRARCLSDVSAQAGEYTRQHQTCGAYCRGESVDCGEVV